MEKNHRFFPIRLIILILRIYQVAVSPIIGPHCRFHPSCSNYFIEAIEIHGIIIGCYLGIRRLSHCHPWHPGGLDPVPLKKI